MSVEHFVELITVEAWQKYAACRDMSPEIFFPERGQDTRAAKAVCVQCPVQSECLEYALRRSERFGIYGGSSESERRTIRRRRRELTMAS